MTGRKSGLGDRRVAAETVRSTALVYRAWVQILILLLTHSMTTSKLITSL